MIDVLWLNGRSYWDQGLLCQMFKQPGFKEYIDKYDGDGAIVVVPGRFYTSASEVNAIIAPLKWCLLILSSDEESLFPYQDLAHPNMELWVMTPKDDRGDYQIGEGFPEGLPDRITKLPDKPLDWFFSGQVVHNRRYECVKNLVDLPNGELRQTKGFAEGYGENSYTQKMASAKIIPCPSGSVTQDSIRLAEALELGCIPIADDKNPVGEVGYYARIYPDAPFPIITDWADARELIPKLAAEYPHINNRVFAWWQLYKYKLYRKLMASVERLSGVPTQQPFTTVLMVTSVIPSHPSIEMIKTTIKSVKDRMDAPIILGIDGLRDEQQDRRADYGEYIRQLLWYCNQNGIVPVLFDEHQHQANMTRKMLELVETDTILFMEHDTPLVKLAPYKKIVKVIEAGHTHLIRMHFVEEIPSEHYYLMRGKQKIEGLPLTKTVQWSQRPHIAATNLYREMLNEHFKPHWRTMIEDVMHSVVQNNEGRYAMHIYTPDGGIKYSDNLDGRQDDLKYPMELD